MDKYTFLLQDSSSSEESTLFSSSSSSSSSSGSDSEEEHFAKKTRIENYLEVIEKYTDVQFKHHFRVGKVIAERLIDEYQRYRRETATEAFGGREGVGVKGEIYLTLWYLANTETYRQISDRFNVTKSSVYRILHRVINFIVSKSSNYIKWPTESEMSINQIKFANIKNFPRVIGAIDGSHIRINPRKHSQEAYYNRKKYYSILIQAIVDADKKFIDVYCGEAGSIHDARLLRKSNFYKKICERGELIIPGGILLGDSAYPNTNYLVTPYKDFGTLTSQQKNFNYMHSATRIVVENTFGLWKSRFRRLKFFESPNMGFVANCAVAACVLHNLCIMENDAEDWVVPEESFNDDDDSFFNIDNNNTQNSHIPRDEDSNARQEIFSFLNRQNLLGN